MMSYSVMVNECSHKSCDIHETYLLDRVEAEDDAASPEDLAFKGAILRIERSAMELIMEIEQYQLAKTNNA